MKSCYKTRGHRGGKATWRGHRDLRVRDSTKSLCQYFLFQHRVLGSSQCFTEWYLLFLNAEAQRKKSCRMTRGHRGGKATWRGHKDLRVEDSTKSLCQYFLFQHRVFGSSQCFTEWYLLFLNAEAQRMKSCRTTRGHRGGKATSLHLCASAFIFRTQVSEVLVCYAVGI